MALHKILVFMFVVPCFHCCPTKHVEVVAMLYVYTIYTVCSWLLLKFSLPTSMKMAVSKEVNASQATLIFL